MLKELLFGLLYIPVVALLAYQTIDLTEILPSYQIRWPSKKMPQVYRSIIIKKVFARSCLIIVGPVLIGVSTNPKNGFLAIMAVTFFLCAWNYGSSRNVSLRR
jgi:hypothetical protein